MKDYIEVGGIRYIVTHQVVLVPDYGGRPDEKVIAVLEKIPFDSYSEDEEV